MRNIFIFIFILSNMLLPKKSIVVFNPKKERNEQYNYIYYAVEDIVTKNVLLYSDMTLFLEDKSFKSYGEIKSKIRELSDIYKSDVVVTYDVSKYRDGFILYYFIYDRARPKEWLENVIYAKEEDFYFTINKLIEDIYSYSKIKTKKEYKIYKDTYTPLIGYYIDKNKMSENELYKKFYNFYKENIYFNIDYINYLFNANYADNHEEIIDNIQKRLSDNHHYVFYIKAGEYYNRYKINAIPKDINTSINYYKKAIEYMPNNYEYYKALAKAYAIKNDYTNAIYNYEKALNIHGDDLKSLKEITYLMSKDIERNGNDMIKYLTVIVSIDKSDEDSLEELAYIYERIGNIEKALFFYNKLLDSINLEIIKINNESLGATMYYRYTQKKDKIKSKIENFEKINTNFLSNR